MNSEHLANPYTKTKRFHLLIMIIFKHAKFHLRLEHANPQFNRIIKTMHT